MQKSDLAPFAAAALDSWGQGVLSDCNNESMAGFVPFSQLAGDKRSQPRSSMFVAAAMRAGMEQAPVTVRNMSPNGAMVDTPLAPTRGTSVDLMRGPLIARGTVIWSSGNRVGLRFSSEVSVKQWLAAPTAVHQQRVDEMVALVKAGGLP